MADQGTVSDDYGDGYYNEVHLGGGGQYTWESDHWRGFFQMMASRIISLTAPTTVLDVGCARGLLVRALVERGVDARGIDLSEHAIESADESIRDRLSVASATGDVGERVSLITCIEVLEHMSSADAQAAIDSMTAATDRIVFSSSPEDFDEATHVNTHPTAHWAAWFAERGFYRRTDVDLSFLSAWAVLFEKGQPTARDLVANYEQMHAQTNAEMLGKRAGLLESYRQVQALRAQVAEDTSDALTEQAELARTWEAEVHATRKQLLVSRDHSVGVQAEIGRLTREVLRLTTQLRASDRRVRALEKRRDALAEKLASARSRATRATTAATTARHRVGQLEEQAGQQQSLSRRVVRRLRGAGR